MSNKLTKDEAAKELAICQSEGWLAFFEASAEKYSLDVAVLLGMASRETNCISELAYCKRLKN